MTQKNGHEPENRNWMDIAEGDAINEVRHSRGRLPFVAAAIALVAVGGGALFAQSNNPAPSQVQPTSVATEVATAQQATLTPPVASTGIPTIAPVAGGGYNGDDDDDYGDDEEDEDRENEDDDDREDEDDDD